MRWSKLPFRNGRAEGGPQAPFMGPSFFPLLSLITLTSFCRVIELGWRRSHNVLICRTRIQNAILSQPVRNLSFANNRASPPINCGALLSASNVPSRTRTRMRVSLVAKSADAYNTEGTATTITLVIIQHSGCGLP